MLAYGSRPLSRRPSPQPPAGFKAEASLDGPIPREALVAWHSRRLLSLAVRGVRFVRIEGGHERGDAHGAVRVYSIASALEEAPLPHTACTQALGGEWGDVCGCVYVSHSKTGQMIAVPNAGMIS